MSPSQLKAAVLQARPESLFFSRANMKFAGDTMRNYGVRVAFADTWELYRKQPVTHGLQTSAYFRKSDYVRVHIGTLERVKDGTD